jgi:DNA polymerase-4/DNA polymerase V
MVPALKGQPVVTGKERGIIACASYEAKARGIARGMPLYEAKRRCPALVILPSDYETYGLYSRRMFNIMRRYTALVEEYSIDEGFADLTGMRRVFRCSYPDIARALQAEIHRELGLTASVGLAPTKSLAKLCSKFRKPAGLTVLEGHEIHRFLPRIALEKVWGFGPNTVAMLETLGLRTAFDFAARPEAWAARLMGKVGREIWNELRGQVMYPVHPETPAPQATIIKSKTFTPPSQDRAFVYAQLVRNVEFAFRRARRHRLRPRRIGIVLRGQDFHHEGLEAGLSRPTAVTLEVLPLIHEMFDRVFRPGTDYRATLVVLGHLEDDRDEQYALFEDRVRIETLRRATLAMDAVNARYGRQTLRSGATLAASETPAMPRDDLPARRGAVLPGETRRQRLAIPRMTVVV